MPADMLPHQPPRTRRSALLAPIAPLPALQTASPMRAAAIMPQTITAHYSATRREIAAAVSSARAICQPPTCRQSAFTPRHCRRRFFDRRADAH